MTNFLEVLCYITVNVIVSFLQSVFDGSAWMKQAQKHYDTRSTGAIARLSVSLVSGTTSTFRFLFSLLATHDSCIDSVIKPIG
jgi:hypothetical protein